MIHLTSFFTSQTLKFLNLKQSKGNFFKDTDGNVILDLNCAQPLGYNHDVLINARDSNVYDRFLQGKVDVSSVPPSDYADIIGDNIMPVAPLGLTQVHLSDGCSTTANEIALSSAIMQYAMKTRNQNYSKLCVLGFAKGAHGSSIATLSCSDAAANSGKVPTYDWPIAPFPSIKYPFAVNEQANMAEEERCLDATRLLIKQRRDAGKDVAAMIIEPISGLEMQNASPNFYKKLRLMAKQEGITFIVDVTKTGCGQTGKMWGYEHWYLQERDGGAPDMVTFGGKAGISGYFSSYDYRMNAHCASFEQSIDMSQVFNFGFTWRYMQRKSLLELVQDTSSFLKIELENAARDKGYISNVRGKGTAIGFDCYGKEGADSMQKWLLQRGIVVARVGPATLGLRPALILGPAHAANLREAVRSYHPNHDARDAF